MVDTAVPNTLTGHVLTVAAKSEQRETDVREYVHWDVTKAHVPTRRGEANSNGQRQTTYQYDEEIDEEESQDAMSSFSYRMPT